MQEHEPNGPGPDDGDEASRPSEPPDAPAASMGQEPSDRLPREVLDLAQACIRFVEQSVGIRLDFSAETLPVLDHYLATRRADLAARPEAQNLLLRTVGAYFGEVFRRRVGGFWRLDEDPARWEICAEPVYLSFNPIAVAYDAVFHGDDGGPTSKIQLDEEDTELVEARLAELPAVSEEEFYQLATRIEVLDIAVDAAKARMIEAGLGNVTFATDDYDS